MSTRIYVVAVQKDGAGWKVVHRCGSNLPLALTLLDREAVAAPSAVMQLGDGQPNVIKFRDQHTPHDTIVSARETVAVDAERRTNAG